MHVGVVRHVGQTIDGHLSGRPFSHVNDGDLLQSVRLMVQWRRVGRTKITNVKGHADEGTVADMRVREVDRVGGHEADAVAEMRGRRVHCSITDARRRVNGGCARWFPVVHNFHHFFIAIAKTVVNCDDLGWYLLASGGLV